MAQLFLKVIACEIAFREIAHVAAKSRNILDLEFVTQGLHESPRSGQPQLQERIDDVPEGKYDAILLGYGLCGNLVRGLTARHTKLVVPRAHDCITLLLGSKERYNELFQKRIGTYFYSSGWIECQRRCSDQESSNRGGEFLTRAAAGGKVHELFDKWVSQYGDECACHLVEQIGKSMQHYSHGTLIDFDFTKPLRLDDQVKKICKKNAWEYEEIQGDLGLLRRWMDAEWDEASFQVVEPGERIVSKHNEAIVGAEKVQPNPDTV